MLNVVTCQTESEIIGRRVDAHKPNMGLVTWKNFPSGDILKEDISNVWNYLTEKEIKACKRLRIRCIEGGADLTAALKIAEVEYEIYKRRLDI